MTAPPLKVLVSAGEASGDRLAAELLDALAATGPVDARGVVGPALRARGVREVVAGEALAVVGLVEALRVLPLAWRSLERLERSLDADRPDVVVLVDAPDFNLPLARRARARGLPVVLYVSPQVWAWRRGRARALAAMGAEVLCLFPFEPALYTRWGGRAEHVGHPLATTAPLGPPGTDWAVLPGSRRSELRRLLPPLLEVARRLRERHPGSVVRLPLAPGLNRGHLLEVVDDLSPVELVADLPSALGPARAAVVASGTATLETALAGRPQVAVYAVHPLTLALGRVLVRGVRHFAMPNLVLQRVVVPEVLQDLDPDDLLRRLEQVAGDGSQATLPTALRGALASPHATHPATRAAAAVREAAGRRPLPTPEPLAPALAVVGAGLALRLVLAARLGLADDEAYYGLWSQQLAWGYYDHPPAIAALIALGTAVAGPTPFAARAPGILLQTVAAVALLAAVRRSPGRPHLVVLAWLLSTAPLLALGGVLATPDAPLGAAWMLSLAAAAAGAWGLAGLLVGAAAWSKLTGWLLVPVLLLAAPPARRWRLLVGLAGAVAAVTPWLAWCAAHDWVPVRFQAAHGLAATHAPGLAGPVALAGGQLAVAGPVLAVAGVMLLLRGPSPWERGLWWWSGLVPLVLFALASPLALPEPNWPAVAWIGLTVLLAMRGSALDGLARLAALTGGAITAAVALYALSGAGWLPRDPLDRLRTGKALAQALPATPHAVVARRYQEASQVGFHTGRPVTTLPGVGREDQHDLWRLALPAEALYVRPADGVPVEATCCWERVQRLDDVALEHAGRPLGRWEVYRVSGPRGP